MFFKICMMFDNEFFSADNTSVRKKQMQLHNSDLLVVFSKKVKREKKQ